MENLWSNVPSLHIFMSQKTGKNNHQKFQLSYLHIYQTFSRLLGLTFFTTFFILFKFWIYWTLCVCVPVMTEKAAKSSTCSSVKKLSSCFIKHQCTLNPLVPLLNNSTFPFRYISIWVNISLKTVHMLISTSFPEMDWLFSPSFFLVWIAVTCPTSKILQYGAGMLASYTVFNNIATNYELVKEPLYNSS